MAVITFMSDFGESDHYVSSVKARILSVNPGLQIIDISHQIDLHNLAHAAFVLKSVFREFAAGTVHLAAVDTLGSTPSRFLALKIEDHFFVGADNGLFSLVGVKTPSMVVEIARPSNAENSTFPARDILARPCALLASGTGLQDIGIRTTEYTQLIDRQARASKKQISGSVIRVDHYGNLITDIKKKVFDDIRGQRPYAITFARESIEEISQYYGQVEDGDCFVLFNSLGLLEIGIFRGNAAELLGMGYDSPVHIHFKQE
ncbi:MAG TPA: SAM-dependent chlorinase/fluorinase [Cyclobacteriaceae bacterium]|nr:SAM-dependent chlorinase/fluorinase [Cyclobacteriaceae bacterium]